MGNRFVHCWNVGRPNGSNAHTANSMGHYDCKRHMQCLRNASINVWVVWLASIKVWVVWLAF